MKMARPSIDLIIFVVLLSMQLQAAYLRAPPPPTSVYYWRSLFNSSIPHVLSDLLLLSPNEFSGDYFRAILSEMAAVDSPPGGDAKLKYDFPEEERDQFSAKRIHQDVFFLETKLRSGSGMDSAELTMEANKASFLPHSIEQSIPFSSKNMSEILTRFSVQPGSPESLIVKEVFELCERPPLPGELRKCCTTFESLLDYAASLLGKHIKLLTPHLESKSLKPKFSVGDGVRLVANSEVVCHKLDYAYAVFLCHKMKQTDVFEVPLIGDDGSSGTSLAACHRDTSSWSPSHPAFQVLNVKPGTVPICHFLEKGTLVWVPLPAAS